MRPVQRDWRSKRIGELERQLAERDEAIAALIKRVAELEAQAALLLARVTTNSRNSSKAPSKDDSSARKSRPSKKPTGRKRGAQLNHPKHERQLVPEQVVDTLDKVEPTSCSCCAGSRFEWVDVQRFQWAEIPKISPTIHEVQVLTGLCKDCGAWTRAEPETAIPTGSFGPSVCATVGLLMGVYRLSKRATAEVMGTLFGLKMSVGAVVDCQKVLCDALEQPVQQAHAYSQAQPVKNVDETSWKQGKHVAWLWTMVTGLVTVFKIQDRRNTQAAKDLLGPINGILCTDRHGAYNWWPEQLRQTCWAHLMRLFTAFSERKGQSARIGKALLLQANRMFSWWHAMKAGTLDRSTFQRRISGIKNRIQQLLTQGADLDRTKPEDAKTSRSCEKLLKCFTTLWTYVDLEGVEPTNNSAERSIRHGVLWRNGSFGTNSQWGSRFVERILTVRATLRAQRRDIWDFLHEACEAKLHNRAPPSLLPVDLPSDVSQTPDESESQAAA
jgi:transposase